MVAETTAGAAVEEARGTLPVGFRLHNYELLSVLGQGGFGITYYAKDTTLGRDVAIKEYLPAALAVRGSGATVMPRSTQVADDFVWGRERFLEEARILATLDGAPAVVRVYDFLEANGTAYMVMGLARGETLEERLKRDGRLVPAIVPGLLGRLLDGLQAVHDAGFMHRDVKPANIILDAGNNPILIDFGASRASVAGRTTAMTAIFTPRYAAPEQMASGKQGPWTDIYGLSATLYHAITGKAPPSCLKRALEDRYEPLTTLALSGYPPGILRGVDAGLALRFKDRPASIDAWRRILFAPPPAGDETIFERVKPVRRTVPPAVEPPAPQRPSTLDRPPAARPSVARPPPVRPPTVAPPRAAEPAPQPASVYASVTAAFAGINKVVLVAGGLAAIAVGAGAAYLVAPPQGGTSPAVVHEGGAPASPATPPESREKVEAPAGQAAADEAAETSLNLSPLDRRKLQVALTALGFDTQGSDGVFGPRFRQMVAAWQKERGQPATGFLTGAQQQTLLGEAATAVAKFDDDLEKAAAAAKTTSPAAPEPAKAISCQDEAGRRIDFPGAATCPWGLTPAR